MSTPDEPEPGTAAEKRTKMEQLLERTIDSIGQIAMHEAGVLDNHVLALRERLAVARKARGPVELLRDQFDLLPATRALIREDHRARMRLWRSLARRFAEDPAKP